MTIEQVKEKHIEDINKAIDSILNLESYYLQMPNELTQSLRKLNSLRILVEEDFEVV